MTLQEYKKMLQVDVPDLDLSELEHESSRSFQLWNKYHYLYLEELRILQGLEAELNSLRMNRWLYYQGKGTVDEYIKKPYGIKHVKAEAKEHMEVDLDVLKLKKVYQEQERIVNHLETATKEISHRSFYIESATKNIAFHNARE